MTPSTAAIATMVVTPEINISHRTFATTRAAAGSRGGSSSGSLMASIEGRSEELVVAAEEAGERLDRVLAARVNELSRSRHKALILAGRVAIDRAMWRARKLCMRLGGDLADDCYPEKPKRMQWRTYNRL